MNRVAVASRSFSQNVELRAKLLDSYPNVTFNESGTFLSDKDLIAFLDGHTMAITALEILDEHIFSSLPKLKVISKYGVGLDMIDLQAMGSRGIKLGWMGGVNRRSVSELVVAFAISLLRKTSEAMMLMREGGWRQFKGRDLSNCTVGIIGLGNIGKDLVGILKAFGCNILAHDIKDLKEFCRDCNVSQVSLNDVLKYSDVVTLHLPLNKSTTGIISDEKLSLMKQGSLIINTARGGLIDEDALYNRLIDGSILGAALDVFANEPPKNRELLMLPNFICTPHIGGSSEEAIMAMGLAAIEGLSNARDPLEVAADAGMDYFSSDFT